MAKKSPRGGFAVAGCDWVSATDDMAIAGERLSSDEGVGMFGFVGVSSANVTRRTPKKLSGLISTTHQEGVKQRHPHLIMTAPNFAKEKDSTPNNRPIPNVKKPEMPASELPT